MPSQMHSVHILSDMVGCSPPRQAEGRREAEVTGQMELDGAFGAGSECLWAKGAASTFGMAREDAGRRSSAVVRVASWRQAQAPTWLRSVQPNLTQ